MTHVSVDMSQRDAPNWVAEHLGASSRRPRHPFPALMAGETTGRVPVYTAQRSLPITPENATAETSAVNCTSGPMTMMVMSPYRYTSRWWWWWRLLNG